ncbi:hypothetical protein D3C86_1831960 [compost metagenome]
MVGICQKNEEMLQRWYCRSEASILLALWALIQEFFLDRSEALPDFLFFHRADIDQSFSRELASVDSKNEGLLCIFESFPEIPNQIFFETL